MAQMEAALQLQHTAAADVREVEVARREAEATAAEEHVAARQVGTACGGGSSLCVGWRCWRLTLDGTLDGSADLRCACECRQLGLYIWRPGAKYTVTPPRNPPLHFPTAAQARLQEQQQEVSAAQRAAEELEQQVGAGFVGSSAEPVLLRCRWIAARGCGGVDSREHDQQGSPQCACASFPTSDGALALLPYCTTRPPLTRCALRLRRSALPLALQCTAPRRR